MATFWIAVRCGKRLNRWNTMPIWALIGARSRSLTGM